MHLSLIAKMDLLLANMKDFLQDPLQNWQEHDLAHNEPCDTSDAQLSRHGMPVLTCDVAQIDHSYLAGAGAELREVLAKRLIKTEVFFDCIDSDGMLLAEQDDSSGGCLSGSDISSALSIASPRNELANVSMFTDVPLIHTNDISLPFAEQDDGSEGCLNFSSISPVFGIESLNSNLDNTSVNARDPLLAASEPNRTDGGFGGDGLVGGGWVGRFAGASSTGLWANLVARFGGSNNS